MAQAPDKDRVPSLQGMAVLIVEADVLTAVSLADAVASIGATPVGPANTTSEALALIGAQEIDVAVVDVSLGDEFSYSVLDKLMSAGTPIVVATGYPAHMIPPQYRHLPRWMKPYVPISLAYALKARRR